MKGIKTIIIYEPTGGKVCSDGDVVETAHHIINTGYPEIVVSTGLILDAIRVMLHTGEIDVDEVEFQFEGKVLAHGQDGRFEDWPNGFNDTLLQLLQSM